MHRRAFFDRLKGELFKSFPLKIVFDAEAQNVGRPLNRQSTVKYPSMCMSFREWDKRIHR